MTLSLRNRPANAKTVKIIKPNTRIVSTADVQVKELNSSNATQADLESQSSLLDAAATPQPQYTAAIQNFEAPTNFSDTEESESYKRELEQTQSVMAAPSLSGVLHNLSYTDIRKLEKDYFTFGNLGERFDLPGSSADTTSAYDDGVDVNIIEQRFLSKKLRAAQLPEETLLELLMVLASQDLENSNLAYTMDKSGRSLYLRARHVKLRRLLFNNPFLDYFNSLGGTDGLSDDKKWNLWGKAFLESNTREFDLPSTTPEAVIARNEGNPLFITAYGTGKKDNTTAVVRVITPDDIQYWRNSFKSFSDFTKAINLLRSWSFVHDNKQWCYNFLFPFGPDCLYAEITKDHVFKNNYLNGAGLLMFSMLQRAQSHDDSLFVFKALSQRFLNANNAFNVLARVLNGNAQDTTYWLEQFEQDVRLNKVQRQYDIDSDKIIDTFKASNTIYLPYKQHRVFDQLTLDFKHLLELKNQLNQNDLFHALSLIGTLNLIVYYQEVCQRLIEFSGGGECNIDMVVECNHDSGISLRRLATSRQHDNDALLKRAVQEMFKRYITNLFPGLKENTALDANEYSMLMDILIRSFSLNKAFSNRCSYEECQKMAAKALDEQDGSPSNKVQVTFGLLQKRLMEEEAKMITHMLGLHRSFGQQIGLSSRDKARAVRYVLSDDLVRSLVLATVDKSKQLMLLDDFLSELNTKYHLVIGPHEAKKYLVSAQAVNKNKDESQFTANLDAFKEQLKRLGFLIDLSDTASYVKNPYLD